MKGTGCLTRCASASPIVVSSKEGAASNPVVYLDENLEEGTHNEPDVFLRVFAQRLSRNISV